MFYMYCYCSVFYFYNTLTINSVFMPICVGVAIVAVQ